MKRVALLLALSMGIMVTLAYVKRGWIREKYELGWYYWYSQSMTKADKKVSWIAHGGGTVLGLDKSNSLDALNYNYGRGCRYFELDFCWTSDDRLVALHDWDKSKQHFFGGDYGALRHEDFMSLEMLGGVEQMEIGDVIKWLLMHQDAYLVTDIKKNNLKGLSLISKHYPMARDLIIPQVYHFYEYKKVVSMGYQNIILTLYQSNYFDREVVSFAGKVNLFGVTMPYKRAVTDLPMMLSSIGVNSYVHGVEQKEMLEELRQKGIDGAYTGNPRF